MSYEGDLLSDPLGYASGESKLGGLGGLGGFGGFNKGDFADALGAIGMSLMSATDRRMPLANFPQFYTKAREEGQTREALKMLAKQAGYSEEEADRLARNPEILKQAIALKTQEKAMGIDPAADLQKMQSGGQAAPRTGGSVPSGPTDTFKTPWDAPRSSYDTPQLGGAGLGPSMIGQPMLSAATTSGPAVDGGNATLNLIKDREGFRPTPYYDVNAYRVGYGSDQVTKPDGTVVPVTKGMQITRDDAERDLARRAAEFQGGIKSKIGADTWNSLPDQAKAALTSVAYNYGELPDRVARVAKSGDLTQIGQAVSSLASDNNSVNAKRRALEASLIIGAKNSLSVPSNVMAYAPQQVASTDPTFVPSRNPALGNNGQGLSQIGQVMSAEAARAPVQTAQAQSMSLSDALRSRPLQLQSQASTSAGSATDASQPSSTSQIDAIRADAKDKVARYGAAIDKMTRLKGKDAVPQTWIKIYDQALKQLEPNEFDQTAARANLSPEDLQLAARTKLGLEKGPNEKLADALTNWKKYNLPDPSDPANAKYWRGMSEKMLGGQQTNVTVNNAVDPLIKGGGEEADDIIKTGREAARGIYTLHEARAQLDKPGGIISGFGSDKIMNMKRAAAFFGADDTQVTNTQTYISTVGQAVLNQAKALGANPSNEDAKRINQILGGSTDLNEKTMRNILDFQENLLRRKIREANGVIDQYAETYSDEPEKLKSVKARRIREPDTYKKPGDEANGALAPGAYVYDPATGTMKPK